MTSYIGTPVSRVDGRLKVTGAAQYAGEFNQPDLVHGQVVEATIAKGRITRINTSQALRVAGVLDVLTHQHRPPLAEDPAAWQDDVAPGGVPFRPLYDDKVLFSRQPVALVLATDWETACFAAGLVEVEYELECPGTDLLAKRDQAFAVDKPDKPRGDAARALAVAETSHEAEYFIPVEHHNPMELFASTVIWKGAGDLTVYDKSQGVQNVQRYLCHVFDKRPDELKVLSPFVGGAFGSGLRPQYQVVLAVLGALALQRSVRVVLTRAQMYALGHRPATIEHLALGAAADGTLSAITHEALAETSQFESFSRNDTAWSAQLYRCANARYQHRLARLDLSSPCDMRAPGAATGVYALECAMDEFAVALSCDPLELRLRCYSDRDQSDDLPYTSKQLRACYRQGAEAFGWERRSREPRSMRDGGELVGWGMASGVWEALQMKTSARIELTANGHAEISSGTMDIGTGTYTIMAQVAADMLGLPLDNVTVRLGDSTLPFAPVEGGSWTAASVSHAIVRASDKVRARLFQLTKDMVSSPLAGLAASEVIFAGGRIVSRDDPSRGISVADVMRFAGVDRIEEESDNQLAKDPAHARNTHSAVFAEVKVDEDLGVIRVTRVVSAVAAGRILNPKTARSQIIGSVVWGIGMALQEETQIDHRLGRVMNPNIAEYHVPVNADIYDIEVIFVDEPDPLINTLGVKGVGEIGIVGVAAAIANAVYHATGKRVRDLPISLDKVLE